MLYYYCQIKVDTNKEREETTMRFTKVLRNYVEDELTKKRIEANKNDPETQAYQARRKKAIADIEEIVKEANRQASEILTACNLEFFESAYNVRLISFNDGSIFNQKEFDAQRKREHDRYEKQKKAIQEIEVNCTLGADKAEFMRMLSEVSF